MQEASEYQAQALITRPVGFAILLQIFLGPHTAYKEGLLPPFMAISLAVMEPGGAHTWPSVRSTNHPWFYPTYEKLQ